MDKEEYRMDEPEKPDMLRFEEESSGRVHTFCLQAGQRALVTIFETKENECFNASLFDAMGGTTKEDGDTAALCAAAALSAVDGLAGADKNVLTQDLFGVVRDYISGIIIKRILEGNYHVCDK